MAAIHSLSLKYGFRIIEDASHAIGGKYREEPIGNCRYSDITVFSFHPVKIITTGEGGMAVTNNGEYAERMKLFRSHGITRDSRLMTKEMDGPWYYQQVALGFNYRMTDLQGALGVSQMTRINQFVARRHELAGRYNELLKDFPLTTPRYDSDGYSGLHLYVIRLHLNEIQKTHLEVFENLREEGIIVNLHYIPVHLQPYYQKLGFKVGQFPEAERFYTEAISLPMYPTLSSEQQDQVVEAISKELL
jgi:dTDP-4-amino-4,6-dideoxygalactose transaminase